jgi:hypothetical protein
MNQVDSALTLLFAAPASETPPSYLQVVRWASAGEVDVWTRVVDVIPAEVRGNDCIPVALPESEKPPGTGPFRLEFFVSAASLTAGERPEWRNIPGPAAGTKILNLKIFGSSDLAANFDMRDDGRSQSLH